MSWYWDAGQVFFGILLVCAVCGLFALALVAAISHGDRDTEEKAFLRWTARAVMVLPVAAFASLIAWPLLALPALIAGALILYRMAWIEPPDEKADRLRRERDARDAEIRRMEREAGIR